jgi:FkbM family methyltransferase
MQALLKLARKIAIQIRRVPGTHLVINAVRQLAFGKGDVIIDDFDRTLRMKLSLSEHMGSQIFWFGFYNRDILMLMSRRLLRPGMTFIDGGANIGEVTLFAAKRVGPSGRIVSFEPLTRLAALCRANVAMNGFDHVSVEELGLSDHAGDLPCYIASELYSDGSFHDGQATLYASDLRGQIVQSIKLTTIDDYFASKAIDRVDGIKLDIEGAELSALRGARQVLERFRPWLIIEIGLETCEAAGYRGEAIFDFLSPLGYRFFKIGRKGRLYPMQKADICWFQNVLCTSGSDVDI